MASWNTHVHANPLIVAACCIPFKQAVATAPSLFRQTTRFRVGEMHPEARPGAFNFLTWNMTGTINADMYCADDIIFQLRIPFFLLPCANNAW